MHIRKTTPVDAEQIYEVHDSNGESDEWDDISECREQIEWMAQRCATSVVAEIDGKIVGEMKVWWGEDVPDLGRSLDISTLYVHRDYHRRGIGTALIYRAVEISRENDCDCVSVWSDEQAIEFYRKQGFAPGLTLHHFDVDPSSLLPNEDLEIRQVNLRDIAPPAGYELHTHRILHPSQRWHDLVKQEESVSIRMDADHLLSPIFAFLIRSFKHNVSSLVVYRLFYWENDPKKAELYLWSQDPIKHILPVSLGLANRIGVSSVAIIAYGDVADTVLGLGGSRRGRNIHVLVHKNK